MASDRLVTAAIAAAIALPGLALLGLPWLPRDQDNPLPGTFQPGCVGFDEVERVLAAHDAACRDGDVTAFRRVVTEVHCRSIERRVERLGRVLDASALRDYQGDAGFLPLLQDGFLHGQSFGARAVLAVRDRRDDDVDAAVLLLTLQWDGRGFALAGVEHLPRLRAGDLAGIGAQVTRRLHAE